MTAHLGNPLPSPAIMERIGTAFRAAVDRFAVENKTRWCGSARMTASSR
jgi:hypothetical protein